mgnify:CR=1 FL=1
MAEHQANHFQANSLLCSQECYVLSEGFRNLGTHGLDQEGLLEGTIHQGFHSRLVSCHALLGYTVKGQFHSRKRQHRELNLLLKFFGR